MSFEATVYFNNVDSVSAPLDLSDLSLFSYNTEGGPASLFVKGSHSSPNISGIACMGLPTVADPDCAITSPNPIAMFHYSWTNLSQSDFRPGRHSLHDRRPDHHAGPYNRGAGTLDLGLDGARLRRAGTCQPPRRARLIKLLVEGHRVGGPSNMG